MGLFVKQSEQRSQLQSKIAADLSERLNKQPLGADPATTRPAILDNQRSTSPLAWLWILLIIGLIVGAVFVVMPR